MSGPAHAPLQPSSAARWVQCAASVSLEALFPEGDSEDAREGTLAHEVAAHMLRHGGNIVSLENASDPNVTDEMLDGAEMLFDDVQAVRKLLNPSVSVQVEERVDCREIHPDCWGTPDVKLLDVALNKLYIWDYKFGHRYVDPFENWQLLAYAIGALRNYGSATTESIRIHLRIVQPRSYHPSGPVREWVIYGSQLKEYMARLQIAAGLAMLPDAVATVGAECRDCKARHACTTLQEASYSVVQHARTGASHTMLPGALGRELATLSAAQDILKARIGGLENEVLATIKSGGNVPGWMVQQGAGRQKWNKPIEEILALGQMMGVDVAKPGAVTPKQAVKAGIPEAVVASYSDTPAGEIKLVRDNGAQARQVFAK